MDIMSNIESKLNNQKINYTVDVFKAMGCYMVACGYTNVFIGVGERAPLPITTAMRCDISESLGSTPDYERYSFDGWICE